MREESAPVALARESLQYFLLRDTPMPEPKHPADLLSGQAGVFVSLKKHGRLRGCIGTFTPTKKTIAGEIIANALSAATSDPRFSPVTADEMSDLEISVDILTPPEPVNDLNDLDPRRYGVIVRRGRRSGLLLPDLEGVDTVEEQVGIAMQKAGIAAHEEIDLYRFEVKRFR